MCYERRGSQLPPKFWPTRLLDPRTCTAYQRGASNSYDGDIEPRYVAVSYTWNRFAAPGKWQRSQVKNVPWRIPVVRDYHFTPERLNEVLQEAVDRANVRFCWLDIFCIDQSLSPSQSEEVHYQPSIFRCATETFVWLTRTPSDILTALQDRWRKCVESEADHLDQLASSLAAVLEDPWFSSLWTLQEAEPNTRIIAREGVSVPSSKLSHPGNTFDTGFSMSSRESSLTLRDLSLYSRFYAKEHSWSPWDFAQLATSERQNAPVLAIKLRRAGLLDTYLFNPNLLYQLAQFREVNKLQDRLHYIRRDVFNMVQDASPMGHTARPVSPSQLDSLHLDIILKAPVQSQLFLATSLQPQGPSWALAPDVFVPNFPFLARYLEQHITLCEVTHGVWPSVNVSGFACSLQVFVRSLTGAQNLSIQFYLQIASVWLDDPANLCMYDASTEVEGIDFEELGPIAENIVPSTREAMAEALQRLCYNSVPMSTPPVMTESNIVLFQISQASRSSGDNAAYFIGLILERSITPTTDSSPRSTTSIGHWRRRGVCFWMQCPSQAPHAKTPSSPAYQPRPNCLDTLGIEYFRLEEAKLY